MADPGERERAVPVHKVTPDGIQAGDDQVAVEEPMEIRVVFGPEDGRSARSLSVTMRTPGNDFELAAGFLFTEGVLKRPTEVRKIEFCGPPAPGRSTSNIVRLDLDPSVELDLKRAERNFYTTSSCGICGKASLDALEVPGLAHLDPSRPRVRRSLIHTLPQVLRAAQPVFHSTGGLHAAALVDGDGGLIDVREDVGRHNAVDKLLGRSFLDGGPPLSDAMMIVSGRTSFEILQKALSAGVPLVVGVGAPSSLAVEMARRFGMTLIGFASRGRYNIYTEPGRIIEG